jgi:hypothetical protein
MYFGGMTGINEFNPAEMNGALQINNYPLELIGITKYSENKYSSINCLSEFRSQQQITLEPGDKYLSVDFILLDYMDRNCNYAYKIEGFNKDWNHISEGKIQISGLPIGNYKLVIKAQLESGEWNAVELKIPIIVKPPFYKTYSFFFLCVLLFSIAVFIFIRMRTLKLQKTNKYLENTVNERTINLTEILKEKELLLSENTILLTEIHHRVKNNLQVINGLLELRKSVFKHKKYKDAFSEGQSSIITIARIHELLYQHDDFGSLQFIIIAQNITNGISDLFAAQKKHIKFEFGDSKICIDIDTAVPLGLILNELLTNAYKYLPLHANNKVYINLIDLSNGQYQFVFQDNGPGLDPEINLQNATSIGFSIVKRLATQIEGSLQYEFDHGAKFTITYLVAATAVY